MKGFLIEIIKMNSSIEESYFISEYFFKFQNMLPYGIKKYNNKISTDIERFIAKDIEEIEDRGFNEDFNKTNTSLICLNKKIIYDDKILLGILRYHLIKVKELTRKYPTCYWYIKTITKDSIEEYDFNDTIENTENDKTSGGYEFWIKNNEKLEKISSYEEALKSHLSFLANGDYKMAKFMMKIAKKMNDNPKNYN